MTRGLALSARQITAICKGAAKAGFVAEIVVNGMVIRLVPEPQATKRTVASIVDDGLESWDDYQHQDISTRAGGYPLGTGRKGDPLQDWYDRLGFDPRTMGEAEMMQLQKAAEERWKAWIPGTPLQKREREALRQLNAFGPNVPVLWSKIKNCGPDTTERLQARGFLETTPHPKHPESVEFLILTEAGQREADEQSA